MYIYKYYLYIFVYVFVYMYVYINKFLIFLYKEIFATSIRFFNRKQQQRRSRGIWLL